MIQKPTLWLIILIFGLSPWCTIIAQQSVVEDFKITITFVDEPTSDLQIYKAPLKYNKDFALVLQLNNGNAAINDQVLPYFKGQAGNPGLYFTEGQANSIQAFKMDAVHFLFDENGTDIHDFQAGYLNWDNIINLWAGDFGIVANGLSKPAIEDAGVEVARSKSYTQRKTLSATIPGGYRTQVYVVPQFETDQLPIAKERFLAVYSNGSGAFPNPVDAEELTSINGIQLSRTPFTNGFFNQIQVLAQQSSETNHPVATYFLEDFESGINFEQFKLEMNQVANTFGRNGSDRIWSATSTEVIEYMKVKELTEVQTTINGNIVEITFSANDMPADLHDYCLTLMVEGESNIVEMIVEEPDNISTYRSSGSEALLNLKWRGSVVPDLETQAGMAVDQAEATLDPADALSAMDYVQMLADGDIKESLRDRLCALSFNYEIGFCPKNEFLGSDTAVCFGTILSFEAPEAESYIWSTGETSRIIDFECLSDTTLWAQVELANGSVLSDTIQISTIALPAVQITTSADTIGPSEEVRLIASGAASYLWNDGSINDTLIAMPEQTETFIVSGTSEAGCVQTDTATIVVQYLVEVDFTFDTVCYGIATNHFSRIESNDSILIKEWDLNGDGIFGDAYGDTVQYLYLQPGEQLSGLRVKTKSGRLVTKYHAIPVADYPIGKFEYSNNCEGQTVQFTDLSMVTVGFPASWEWDLGNGVIADYQHPSYFYDEAGTYSVSLIVTSNYGCSDTIKNNVTVHSAPIIDLRLLDGTAVAEDAEVKMKKGGSLTFSIESPYDSLLWSDGVTTETFRVINAGVYDVEIFYQGCPNSRTFTVVETEGPIDPTAGIMNLITPNGDGYNDKWLIDLSTYGSAKVSVYSRNGRQVYNSNDYQNDWDGRFNGNPLPEGTYYYIIESADGKVIKGPISILR
ncbi:MAG: gliding motility-associated C-terminal domain-containing protein [Bacteroidales bacterium]|jgi:gliding motility-associated-like protein|nr:gliding motility-associated C-terminal domain-containing protein [Bacteroidales bacterium]HOI31868.1 gliding motility-associated C-terminal domain-containing protein [Bacteroidales bacterium]